MWFKSEKQERAAVIDTIDINPPSMPNRYEAKPDMTSDEMAEYEKVATAIGLTNSEALFNERMRNCCAENGFRIYDSDQVVKFVNFKLGKGKWQWMGLRDKDAEHLKGWHSTINGEKIDFGKQYGRRVPLPVLLTVQRVLEDVPEAHFYISGVPGVDDDPFLLVTRQNGSSFIIERWDEPDFRER